MLDRRKACPRPRPPLASPCRLAAPPPRRLAASPPRRLAATPSPSPFTLALTASSPRLHPSLSSSPPGVVEAGTDHARAPGLAGGVHELACEPFCLFNLTADLGEVRDLARTPELAPLAARMLARLQHHGSTGPPPSYIWPNLTRWIDAVERLCERSEASGSAQPLDDGGRSIEVGWRQGRGRAGEVWLDDPRQLTQAR